MKNKILYCFCAAAVLAAAVSCQEKANTGYEGKNYIELSAAVASTYDVPGLDPVSVEVNLTTSLDEDLTLNFVVKSDDNGVLELTDNPVVIAAGETSASFGIAVGNSLPAGVSSAEFEITLDESVELPENVQLSEDLKFSVKAASTSELTEDQKALVAAYKEKTGIDLSKYLGLVSVNVEFWEVPFDTEDYPDAPEKISTQSIIWLSSESTADAPVLDMVDNPMGITDRLYKTFRSITVQSPYWTDEEYAGPDYATLMNGINWNADSKETFEMSLMGITLDAARNITFTKESVDEYEDVMTVVPFDFYFSAYEREKVTELEIDEGSDATANPYMHLNNADTAEDGYGTEGAGFWVKTEASISEKEMKFTFCIDYNGASDYIKVVATYTPNK